MPLLHKIAGVVIVCAVVLGLTLPGERRGRDAGTAAERAGAASEATPPVRAAKAGGTPAPAGPGTAGPSGAPSASASAPIPAAAPAAVAAKANELGQVPVLMYHRIMKKPEQSLDRSAKELYDELTRLAKDGYCPITAAEFVGGRFNVPAGRHPVVLTFDDSTPGHFGLDAQGNPKPDTAVAIIEQVARENPGFRPVATFYLNKELFGMDDVQAGAGLKWLQQHGFELGNHTVTHPSLSGMSEKGVRKEIGDMEDRIVKLTGAHTTTFAYPFGSVPKKAGWAEKDGGRYSFQGLFLAGWRPSVSPFDADYDRRKIDRIRSEGKIKENDCKKYCSTAWLEYLDKNPDERYTSDGDPNTVTFPKAAEDRLAKEYRARARTY
ncbi:polysaccharide deacetylase family protein [Actinomadura latina]|uniref:Polysaccharide deacetylase family protein n=1 Tax=Actinomadura latina TaxID=163603 RepID=A0A846YZK0_9ACTN|nr:polysaccharide deacetylase family protein [Actinomadura latina]NKZ05127.1 polysaccharide deacetylase family protein [Actinomadura latina]